MTPTLSNPWMEIQSSCGGVEGNAGSPSKDFYAETITAPSASKNPEITGSVNAGPARNGAAGIDPGPQDYGGLAAVAAELSDALRFLPADPEPPPGPSDDEELEAILTRLQAA